MLFANNIKFLINAFKSTDGSHYFIFFCLHVINFFGWTWTTNFIDGVKNMIVSGSSATWYWSYNKKNVPKDSVELSVATVMK